MLLHGPFKRILAAGAVALPALLASSLANAQAGEPWKFEATIYGYLPALSGTTTFPAPGGGNSASVDASKIIDNLKFTFMGTLEANKGPWGVFSDFLYVDLGNSKSQSRDILIRGVLPAGATADISYDVKGSMWTLAGTWRALQTPRYTLQVLAGTRMLDVNQTLNYQLSGNIGSFATPDLAGSRSTGTTNWDAIVGVKGRAAFGESGRWFVPYYLDIGAGQSKFTWQAAAGVGYAFSWGDVVGVWRYIDYEMKSGKPIESLNMSGPALAAIWHW